MASTLEIEALAPGGEGVGRDAGRSVFVPFTAPGDRVEVEVRAGEKGTHAELVRVERGGPSRVEPRCRHFGIAPDGRCGGCEWLHLEYGTQLEAKARSLEETLRRIGRLEPGSYALRSIVPSPDPVRYRSRAKFHFERESGKLIFFQRRSHVPVRLEECWLLEEGLDRLRAEVGPALAAVKLAPREVLLEWSAHAGRGSAWLQLVDLGPAVQARAEALLEAVPALAGLVLTTGEERRGVAARGPVLVGSPVLMHQRVPGDPGAGVIASRPDVFQQANRKANARLIDVAMELLRPEGEDVLELFCGAGNFTGPLAARARSVAAVEGQGPSLELARAAEQRVRDGGGESKVRFFTGDAVAMALAFARESGAQARRFGVALLDPPRDGARGIGPALRDLGVKRAVYVSCDPATFARDLHGCVGAGFRVEAVQPVDMFPQTHHVECVGSLVRRG
jgi:23S rRNA (uracil1939-C5)-methyltransferase